MPGVLLYCIQQGLMNLDEHDESFLKVFTPSILIAGS